MKLKEGPNSGNDCDVQDNNHRMVGQGRARTPDTSALALTRAARHSLGWKSNQASETPSIEAVFSTPTATFEHLGLGKHGAKNPKSPPMPSFFFFFFFFFPHYSLLLYYYNLLVVLYYRS